MTAVETPTPAPLASPRHSAPRGRVSRLCAAGLALLFFFGPALAYAAGVRPQEIENRRLAALPSLSDGWDFFAKFTAWSTDHLPLRGEAVEANTRLSELVFDQTPQYDGARASDTAAPKAPAGVGGAAAAPAPVPGNFALPKGKFAPVAYPKVIGGREGWLYLGADVSAPCQPTRPVADSLARLARLQRVVEASGRTIVLTVAPDKSTIVPQFLPETYLGEECSTERRKQFWAAMRANAPTAYVDLRTPLEEQQERQGTPIYRKTDTHWGSYASGIYAREVADRIDPRLWQATDVRPAGSRTRLGDLSALLGLKEPEVVPQFEFRREVRRAAAAADSRDRGLPDIGATPRQVTVVSEGDPVHPGRTLLLGDSFSITSRPAFVNLYADLTLLHHTLAQPETIAEQVRRADTVIVEIVERDASSGGARLLADEALNAIERALASRPNPPPSPRPSQPGG